MSQHKTSICVLNGPNLNLLGSRETSTYGMTSFETYLQDLRIQFSDIDIQYVQSNLEGDIVTALHSCAQQKVFGIVLNAAAYTHTSVAIGDAIAAIDVPVVEVHISNVYAREEFRHLSYLSAKAIGVISGFGLDSYRLGIEALLQTQAQSATSNY